MSGRVEGMDEGEKRRKAKNWAMLAALAGLAILFYLVAVVKFGAGAP